MRYFVWVDYLKILIAYIDIVGCKCGENKFQYAGSLSFLQFKVKDDYLDNFQLDNWLDCQYLYIVKTSIHPSINLIFFSPLV